MTVYLGKNPVGVGRIVEKKVAKTKFGASIDNFIGDVDGSGLYSLDQKTFTIDLSQIKQLKDQFIAFYNEDGTLETIVRQLPFQYKFYGCANLVGSVDLQNLETAEYYCSLDYAFSRTAIEEILLPKNPNELQMNYICEQCPRLKRVVFSCEELGTGVLSIQGGFAACDALTEIVGSENIKKIGAYGLNKTFQQSGIKTLNLGGLTEINGTSACEYVAWNCTKLTSVNVSNLKTISGNYAMRYALKGCTALERLDFPALISVSGTAPFGNTTSNGIVSGCTALKEIHFRADMQAIIEAMTGYDTKWGATNATIYFDL